MTKWFNNITPWAKLPSAWWKTKLWNFSFNSLWDIIIDDVWFKPSVVLFFAWDNSVATSIWIWDWVQQSVINNWAQTIIADWGRVIFNWNPARSNVRLVELNDNWFKLNVFYYSDETITTDVFYLAIW